jgi:hypothetical protein
MSASLQSLLVGQGGAASVGVLFPAFREEFVVRRPSIAINARWKHRSNDHTHTGPADQTVIRREEDVLVRLPSMRESKWKVAVLQRWIGRVEEVKNDTFIGVISDATNPSNSPEQVELDFGEVSPGDLGLIVCGASFYWSIGYSTSPGGQRERVSALRFARLPRLSKTETDLIIARADLLTALLEND